LYGRETKVYETLQHEQNGGLELAWSPYNTSNFLTKQL